MSLLPQFGFIELMVVAIVALIVVGPKDLPILLRNCGQMLAKAKKMAGEFTSAFDQMARDVEMDELRAEMEALKRNNPITDLKDEVDLAFKPVTKEVSETIQEGEAAHCAEMDTIKNATNVPVSNDASLSNLDDTRLPNDTAKPKSKTAPNTPVV